MATKFDSNNIQNTNESFRRSKVAVGRVNQLLDNLNGYLDHIKTLQNDDEKKIYYGKFNSDVDRLNQFVKVLTSLAFSLVNGKYKESSKGSVLNRNFLSQLKQLHTTFHKIGVVSEKNIEVQIKDYKKVFNHITDFFKNFKY